MEKSVLCVLIPRFPLLAATATRQDLLAKPLALAPEPGGPSLVGEVSGPAEAFGVRARMSLGEALARCPELTLVPPDPGRADTAWERVLRRLEGIGAAVEPGRSGEAFFEASGLLGALWRAPGRRDRKPAGGWRAEPVGSGPTRFCPMRRHGGRGPGGADGPGGRGAGVPRAVAGRAAVTAGERRRRSCRLRAARGRDAREPAALPEAAVADRFGAPGLRARRLRRRRGRAASTAAGGGGAIRGARAARGRLGGAARAGA